MAKPFDVTKFRKTITKSIDGLGIGFNDPDTWVSTGNYALNYLISSDFNKGIPLGKVTVLAGESGCLPSSGTVRVCVGNDTKDVTVVELCEMFHSNADNFKIDTPDGYCKITNWFNKGVLPTVSVTAGELVTQCAENHLLQTPTGEWIPAGSVTIGTELLTVNGTATVDAVASLEPEECYDFTVDHPNHRYWGDGFSSHNSGKSYICSGNIVRNAQEQGIFVVLIDSENALDEAWLHALGVDTSDEKLLKLNMAMIDDVAKTISEFMKSFKEIPEDSRPKVLFVIDSLGMLLTPTDVDQFNKGELKGDMGRKPKALTALVRNCVNMFGSFNVGLVATNHTYASQDMFDPDDKISGGQGFIYASSIVIAMRKLKLKEDDDGVKTTDIRGIRSACKIMKTRYAKPFESVQIKIPYDTGMNPYSGLVDLFEGKGWLQKEGNSLKFEFADGTVIKKFRKNWERNEDQCLELAMEEVMKMPSRDKSAVEDEDVIEPSESVEVKETTETNEI